VTEKPKASPQALDVKVNAAKELGEISRDFLKPIEVLREALANGYDAGAAEVVIRAWSANDPTGRRIMNLEIRDDGEGMNTTGLEGFFGLGFTTKPRVPGRTPIGVKGHGTKIYYQANEIWIATRSTGGPLLVACVENARRDVLNATLPKPTSWEGKDAEEWARAQELWDSRQRGTVIRLIDYTADSGRLIDDFKRKPLENYIRWFTIYGSFRHIVEARPPEAPLRLRLQATDDLQTLPVEYGHPWPDQDETDVKSLRKRDERRPFNFFTKSFRNTNLVVKGGYRIDIAVAFEGKRTREARDSCIRRQRAGGLYFEEERYGLWLCRDYLPIEMRSDWLQHDELALFNDLEPKRALVLVNCQDLRLTANRGSVGNSEANVVEAVRQGVLDYLESLEDDQDLARFREEYEEDRLRRVREKDRKAFQRRLERYNRKMWCTIRIPPDLDEFTFFEPTREATLFGLLCQLEVVDPTLLEIDVLDYDDHKGLDYLVRMPGDATDQLTRDRVAYVELKYELEPILNHAFDNMAAVICWDSALGKGSVVEDAAGERFTLQESEVSDGPTKVTYSVLSPQPNSKFNHQVRVIVLKRLLRERRAYVEQRNPKQINGRHAR
jgi:hypothetical protein